MNEAPEKRPHPSSKPNLRWVVHSDAGYSAGIAVCWATVQLRGYEGKKAASNDQFRTPRHSVTVSRSTGGSDLAEVLAAGSGLALAKRLDRQRRLAEDAPPARALLVTDSASAVALLSGRAPYNALRRRASRLLESIDYRWSALEYRRTDRSELVRQDKLATSLLTELRNQALLGNSLQPCLDGLALRDNTIEISVIDLPEYRRWWDSSPDNRDASGFALGPDEVLLIQHSLVRAGRSFLDLTAPAGLPVDQVLAYARLPVICDHFPGSPPEVVRAWIGQCSVHSYPLRVISGRSDLALKLMSRYQAPARPPEPLEQAGSSQ